MGALDNAKWYEVIKLSENVMVDWANNKNCQLNDLT